jgi:hypothetical protein
VVAVAVELASPVTVAVAPPAPVVVVALDESLVPPRDVPVVPTLPLLEAAVLEAPADVAEPVVAVGPALDAVEVGPVDVTGPTVPVPPVPLVSTTFWGSDSAEQAANPNTEQPANAKTAQSTWHKRARLTMRANAPDGWN